MGRETKKAGSELASRFLLQSARFQFAAMSARMSRMDIGVRSANVALQQRVKEMDMETIFHILGIAYYTPALVNLVSDMIQRHKNAE